ncbi:RBBP6 ligase, partial [Oxyruncus cristatus]|nr:RBBP6 ligase [Oxyruncus cristatus]
MACKRLKAANSDLQILNAQTSEEYTDPNALILKNSSVIVRRVPAGAGTAASRAEAKCQKNPVKGTPKAVRKPAISHLFLHTTLNSQQLTQILVLAETNVPEEERIKVMMMQSCSYYDPSNYLKVPLAPLPPSNTCFKCGQQGHCKKKCPNTGGRNTEAVPRIKRSSGIPASFMVEVKDPSARGTMITPKGKYAIPIINVEAYARERKEKPPLLQEEPTSSSSPAPIPDELLRLICREIMTDAAVIPCCGRSHCDGCVRTALLESEGHTSPTCHQKGVSADSSNANQLLGQV